MSAGSRKRPTRPHVHATKPTPSPYVAALIVLALFGGCIGFMAAVAWQAVTR